jgi:hypothetical protein
MVDTMGTIPDRLATHLEGIVAQLKNLLSLLNVIRNVYKKTGGDPKDKELYSKTLRSSGKLSCELSNRLDTIKEFISKEEFDSLLKHLGCSWDSEKCRASILRENEETKKLSTGEPKST